MSHLLRRGAALAVAAALAVSTLATPAQAADPPADELAATWLTGQLTGGIIHNDQYAFDDYGLSIDVALALDALGGHEATVAEISAAVAAHVDSYITGVDFGSSDVYAGAIAKAVVLAQAAGADPSSYGGEDLLRRLERRVSATAPIRGRIRDKTDDSDFANVIGQAYAVQGLGVAGSPTAGPALRYLLRQQCAKGYFRLNFTKSKKRADQTCDGGDPATASAPDTDVTALAVLTLTSLHSSNPHVKSAITDAVGWLKKRQKANGSFGGGTSTEASNTNSTGLAGWALGVRHACTAAGAAAGWVDRFQVTGATGGSPLAADIGAVGYDKAAYDGVVAAEEITVAQRDQWRRATAQAAPALANLVVADCQAR
jgi:hypothetical protein